jgi:hypothetical protein
MKLPGKNVTGSNALNNPVVLNIKYPPGYCIRLAGHRILKLTGHVGPIFNQIPFYTDKNLFTGMYIKT